MQVIPVIDLKAGQVVHARGGRRDDYQPVETPLSRTSEPRDVVAGLRRLFPFRQMYIADLDAIEGRGDHSATLSSLEAAVPSVEFWVDNGIGDQNAAGEFFARHAGSLVIGSESQSGTALIESLRDNPRVVLSLDFRGDKFQGPSSILDNTDFWPARIIVMTLARVGAASGPDLFRIADISRRARTQSVYAAGGVRSAQDLAEAAASGAAGALVATALHSGALTTDDLHRLAQA